MEPYRVQFSPTIERDLRRIPSKPFAGFFGPLMVWVLNRGQTE